MVCPITQSPDLQLRSSSEPENMLGGVFPVPTGMRSYSPELGHWINRDPIGERGGLNVMAFVENSSLNMFDRLGLEDSFPIYTETQLAEIFNMARGEIPGDVFQKALDGDEDAAMQMDDWRSEYESVAPMGPREREHSDWNETGIAVVVEDTRIGAFSGLGGEFGRTTLRFDNGYCQRYTILSGGAGLGVPQLVKAAATGSLTKGEVYGVYHWKDYAGPFIGSTFSLFYTKSWSTWPPVWDDDSVSSSTSGLGLPGASGTFQIYIPRGEPFRCCDDGSPVDDSLSP